MNLVELNAIKTHLRKQLSDLESISTTCMSCTNFANGSCKKFDARPPEDWIHEKADCADWNWDTIPF